VFTARRPPHSLRRRFARTLPGLLEHTVAHVAREVPYYGRLSPQQLRTEISHTTLRNLQLFSRLLEEGRSPRPEEVADLLRSVARRAEERIPLPDVLAAYYAGFRSGWQSMAEVARPADLEEVIEVGIQVLRYLEFITARVTETYVETTTALSSKESAARSELLHAVLAGRDRPLHWERAGLVPWTELTVITLLHGPPRGSGDLDAAVVSRRRARGLRDALADLTDAVVLDSFGPTGVYRLSELLFQVQVTRPGPARAGLLEVIEPLAGQPDLLETLRVYAAASGRRGQAAERLHVHPNTLDYRLRRIRDLVGIDPTDIAGWTLLRSALLAHTHVNAHALANANGRRPVATAVREG